MTGNQLLSGALGATALIFGAVDAGQLNETQLSRTTEVAGYTIEAKQVENTIQTTFPWKGQQGLKVSYDMGVPTLMENLLDQRKKEVIIESVDFGEGGFKVDILLNEKPDTNVFCYAIQGAENYDFFYQTPLTQQELDGGMYREPNMEGSYAVYHKTLKNHTLGQENYATGKVMHIPRPQVWSLSDLETKVWADMHYENGNLCVTVPQGFLDTAVYPVRVDPTFGYTSLGATRYAQIATDTGDASNFVGAIVTLPTSGTLTGISVALGSLVDPSTADVATQIYRFNSGGTDIHDLVANSTTITPTMTATQAFYATTFSSPSVTADDYMIGAVADGTDVLGFNYRLYTYGDAGAGSDVYINEENYGVGGFANQLATDPMTTSALIADDTFLLSIYATYTADEGDPTPTPGTLKINNGSMRIDNGRAIIN